MPSRPPSGSASSWDAALRALGWKGPTAGKTNGAAHATAETGQPEPLDLLGAPELVGYPELTEDCLPAPLYRYVMGEAERLNVDPCPIAAHVLAACCTSISDAWSIRSKLHDLTVAAAARGSGPASSRTSAPAAPK